MEEEYILKKESISSFVRRTSAALTASAMLAGGLAILPDTTVFAASDVVIDTTKEYQIIRGFGGMNHPEWTGKDLTEAQRKTAFGNDEGDLGLTVLRVFVNPDRNLWNLALPTAQYATKMGAYVFASPWEPPANLAEKYPNSEIGKLHLPESNYGAYAQHLNDFGTYMKNNGVDLYSISVQNEPDFSSEWTHWTTDETTKFLADYGDLITSTRLMSPESFQYSPENASWIDHGTGDGGKRIYRKILENSKAFANCDLFGTHMYGTARDWMDYPELENCGKEIWMTEVYVPNSETDSANRWPESLDVSENIHNALVVGNMSAYTWWYIRRSYGLMTEDGKISKRGYCMAQYSKYVRPGDIRINATEQPNDDVYVSAYKGDDGQVTIVAVNKSASEYTQKFTISGESISDVDRYRTSASENLAPTLNMEYSNDSFYSQLPANSVTTFVVTVSEEPVEPDENGYFFHSTFEGDTDEWTAHGGSSVTLSGRNPYAGAEALLVQDRTAAWNGVERSLNPNVFVPGQTYSFSTDVVYLDSNASTQTFFLKLQYTGSDGETHYSTVAQAEAVKGVYAQLANTQYTIPEGAKDMKLFIESAEGSDNFYIDEAIGAVAGTEIAGPAPVKLTAGDVNCDGIINVLDLVLAKRGVAKGFPNAVQAMAADVNGDGSATVSDLVMLQKFLLRQITAFEKAEIPTDPPTEPPVSVTPDQFMQTVSSNLSILAPSGIAQPKAGVTYGDLTKYTYFSTTRNRVTNVNVLLPPGYNENETYPVLYALHGYWENEDSLAEMSAAQHMLGNLIASGEAKKMIIVFPYIYTSKEMESCTGMDLKNSLNYDNFINDLTTDLMPYIESTFSVKTGRENTAITGFSMGGRESLFIGLTRSDLFSYVGAACPAPGLTPGDPSMHPGQLQESELHPQKGNPYLILITGGENDNVVYNNPQTYSNILKTNGSANIYHSVPGGAHNYSSVQPHFYNYLRAVFQAN